MHRLNEISCCCELLLRGFKSGQRSIVLDFRGANGRSANAFESTSLPWVDDLLILSPIARLMIYLILERKHDAQFLTSFNKKMRIPYIRKWCVQLSQSYN